MHSPSARALHDLEHYCIILVHTLKHLLPVKRVTYKQFPYLVLVPFSSLLLMSVGGRSSSLELSDCKSRCTYTLWLLHLVWCRIPMTPMTITLRHVCTTVPYRTTKSAEISVHAHSGRDYSIPSKIYMYVNVNYDTWHTLYNIDILVCSGTYYIYPYREKGSWRGRIRTFKWLLHPYSAHALKPSK